MPKLTSITASRSVKVNCGNYESRDAFYSITVEPEPSEDFTQVSEYAQAIAQREIKKIERIIRTGDEDMKVSSIMARRPALPVIGTIRKGGKRGTSTKERFGGGDDLAYFRVEFTDDDAQKMFILAYGEQPTKINIMLPYSEIARNWRVSFEAYNTSGNLQFATDGDEIDSLVVFCAADPARVGTPYQPGRDPKVKAIGRLSVIIPALQRAASLDFVTTSIYDIMRITDALNYYFGEQGDGGLGLPASAIPLIVYRHPEEVAVTIQKKDGSVTRTRSTFSLVKIEVDPEWAKLQLLARQQDAYALVGGRAPLELSAGDIDDYEVDVETGEIVDDATVTHAPASTSAPSQKPAWHHNADNLNRFYAYCEKFNVRGDDIFLALDIEPEAWDTYTGSAKDAKAAIDAYIAQRAEANAQPEQPTLIDAPPARNPNNPADWS